MLRFAVLIHDYPVLHWDLLLEQPGKDTLRTWRLEQPPAGDVLINATALPDHRRLYLDYEGPVSGDRGEVKRFDAGEVQWQRDTEANVTVYLQGQRIQGQAEIWQEAGDAWRFCLKDIAPPEV